MKVSFGALAVSFSAVTITSIGWIAYTCTLMEPKDFVFGLPLLFHENAEFNVVPHAGPGSHATKAARERDDDDAGGHDGCFAGDGVVATGLQGERAVRADELRAGDKVYSPTLGREVDVVATFKGVEKAKICTVGGLRITHRHPIQLPNTTVWQMPKDVAVDGTAKLGQPLTVYNFVVAEGGTMRVNNMTVITLGDQQSAGVPADHPCAHPFYGTSRVIEAMKRRHSWPNCE